MSNGGDWYQNAVVRHELKNIPYESFKKTGRLGRGGFGDIYSATCKSIPTIPEVIALKGVSFEEEDNEMNDILDRLKSTSLIPVFEDSIIPESEAPSDLYLPNIDHDFASLSIIRDPDISTNATDQHALSSVSPKNNSGTTFKPIKISLKNLDELWDFFEKLLHIHSDDSVIKLLILQYLETHKIHETEIFNLLYDNQTNANNNCLLGFFYYVGIGTNQNYDEAFRSFINATQGNNWIAQSYTG
ncbi:19108_t:CDS:2 [Dentiscutata erythropus]|uniref:19108_t:CDS:1 n=1 Tax=Dentiscutata erythropus TaxID=1348616 RepID=A0A9N8WQ10_9GLOM|nr:19108_t:CDS:2 [Dentiscutata erythropus]